MKAAVNWVIPPTNETQGSDPPSGSQQNIRGKFSSRNRIPSNSDCGDILDFVQRVVCLFDEFTMSVFTDSTLKAKQRYLQWKQNMQMFVI